MKKDIFYIAIDIGGTYIRIAGFNSIEEPKFGDIKVFELTHNFENDFNQLVEIIKRITEQKIAFIGVSIPGVLNTEKNALISATNIPEWIKIDLKRKLENHFKCEVYLENDAVASALGEIFYDGNQKEDFIFTIWGTGVGGAVVQVKPVLKVQKLQKEDYLEDIRHKLYGKHLLEKYRKPLGQLESEDWDNIMFDFETLIIYLSNRFKIRNIIVAGGVAINQKERLGQLSQKLKEKEGISLRLTYLGDNHTFGLYGAAALVKYQNDYIDTV